MDMFRTYKRKGLYISLLLVTFLVTGCAGIEPYEARDHREEGPEQGIISGRDGEFVIYRKVDEPDSSIDSGN